MAAHAVSVTIATASGAAGHSMSGSRNTSSSGGGLDPSNTSGLHASFNLNDRYLLAHRLLGPRGIKQATHKAVRGWPEAGHNLSSQSLFATTRPGPACCLNTLSSHGRAT